MSGRVARIAGAAGALVCAASPAFPQGAPSSITSQAPAFAAPAGLAPGAAQILGERGALEDLAGAAWRGATEEAAGGAQVSVFVADPSQFDRPGGALPSEAFGLSNPAAAPAFGAQAMQMDVRVRAVSFDVGGLDFDLGPRAGVASGFGERSVGAGVTARLGQNLRERGGRHSAWYLFAGAGARAVEVAPAPAGFGMADAQVRDKAIVGDLQAGLAFDLGAADLALAYSQRERPIAWAKDPADGFAVLSLSFRH